MTNSSDRLDRIEALVEANSRDIAQLREMVEINSRDIATNTQSIRQLAATAQTQQQTLQATATALIEEIRGLRTENRRILDHLFGEPEG